jgi:uncharacterized protein
MNSFERSILIDCDRQTLFNYHAAPGAINRLIPPWENIRFLKRGDSLDIGTEVLIRQYLFGFPVNWKARHTKLESPTEFEDTQIQGPFRSWVHTHRFEPEGSDSTRMIDRVNYQLPLFGGWTDGWLIRPKLEAMFRYRHQTTASDMRLKRFIDSLANKPRYRIGVTGSTGLIGRRLVDLISVLGHEPIRILRPKSIDNPIDFPSNAARAIWNDIDGGFDSQLVNELDAVVHLAGASLASSRWTEKVKRKLRSSRVETTQRLVADLLRLPSPPKALICASGVGYYGDCKDMIADESSPAGSDFLAELAKDWEEAAYQYQNSGGRVAIGRLGVVLDPRAGALSKLLLPFRFGVGGKFGAGSQYWSWIDVDDAAAGLLALAVSRGCEGAYNLTAPQSVTNREFAATLARVLGRPAFLPIPETLLRWTLGEMADGMLLTSTRAESRRLNLLGFPYRSPTLSECLAHLLGFPTSAA